MPLPVILQTEHLDPEPAAWLAERSVLVVCAPNDPSLSNALAQADGLIVRTYTQVEEQLLTTAPMLKVVGRAGVGLDNIDVSACRRRSIEVVYTPDANTQAVVEYVLALMCDVFRPRVTLDAPLPAVEWNRLRAETLGARQLDELTVGILGLGRVGKGVARVASSVGCRVIYSDLLEIDPSQRFGAEPVSVDDLFATADVVSLHIDGRPSNRGFVNERLLERLKPDALLINTCRGFVVDNLSLVAAFSTRPRASACLDVHEPEPFDADYPLLGLPNVRLYPHLASRTATAMRNMSWVVRDVLAVLEGRAPQFPAPK